VNAYCRIIDMKTFLLLPIYLFVVVTLHAQITIKKGGAIIHVNGSDAWVNHEFDLDIFKDGNSVKIKYSYCDSIKFKELRNDPEFRRLNNEHLKYKAGDPNERSIMDTIGQLIKKHKAYTRDSVTLNLKIDTGYRNLLNRIINTGKDVLMPKIDPRVLDGYGIILNITTVDKNLSALANNPELKTHPLLFSFITQTLDKNKNSNTVQKIRKCYGGF
jgi:hypothetical protein